MSRPLEIHLIAIGGTGMAPLACLLEELGHSVRGSDGPLYPPMSTLLDGAGIRPFVGFDPAHLQPTPDLVVVGNAVPRSNVEAVEAERLGLPLLSMPQAIARFLLADRRPLVVAGTHGKTTTSALAAWVWVAAGRDPGYLVGGVPRDLPASFARGGGERFILEGDEYNAAYFDRGAKFLHYRAETLVLTSVEYDHADLYDTPATLLGAYEQLVKLLPEDGLLIACGDSPEVRTIAARAGCKVVHYGLEPGNDLRPVTWRPDASGVVFSIDDPEEGTTEVRLQLAGRHNLANALAVWAAARADGLPARRVAEGLSRFSGVRRRMEEVGEAGGVVVVDDFAHHPTAISETLPALRQRYPDRRLLAVFEPRSLTAGRALFFDRYLGAFSAADRAFFAPVFHAARLSGEERLDLKRLTASLERTGVPATACDSVERLLEEILAELRPGDLVVTMSSGSFEGLPARLVTGLASRQA